MEPSCATMLTGSPPARVLSMKIGSSNASGGGVRSGQVAPSDIFPSGSNVASKPTTNDTIKRRRTAIPFIQISRGPRKEPALGRDYDAGGPDSCPEGGA